MTVRSGAELSPHGHSGAPARASPESITTIGRMDSGPAPLRDASRNDDRMQLTPSSLQLVKQQMHHSVLATHSAPESCFLVRPSNNERVQGRPGACRPHGPPAEKKVGGSHNRFGQDIPAFPARTVYGLYVISSGTGLIAPVVRKARQRPCDLSASTGTPGPHDFAVRAGSRSSGAAFTSIAARLYVS
jgi:hypothetical protein